jgi:6-pyruvoyltetrahydropterin/6-carboxytetrahydropterin synthase
MSDYSVRIAGDRLIYSAAHFIILPSGECEPLHGHNYRVAVEAGGPLDASGCVVDFGILLEIAKSALAEIDHAVLLPSRSKQIRVAAGDSEVEVRFDSRRWVLPRAECRLLPVESTTVELIAAYLANRVLEGFSAKGMPALTRLRIELEESPGCAAVYEIKA